MSTKRQCTINIKNLTGGTMSRTGGSMDWGNWTTTPPIQITTGTVGNMWAQGTGAYATGTQGSVIYTLPDNGTTFTVTFDVPFTGTNSGGGTLGGTSPSQYTAKETDSTYTTQTSFPGGGDAPTVYFLVGVPAVAVSETGFSIDLKSKVEGATEAEQLLTSINLADVARAARCGVVSSDDLVIAFKGNMVATVEDILGATNIAPSSIVEFVSGRNLIGAQLSFTAAVDFAASYAIVLEDNPEVSKIAAQAIALLRSLNSQGLEAITNELEQAKYSLLAPREGPSVVPKIAAIEAILACIYMDPGAALLQSGSCARQVAADENSFETISKWQLDYLRKALAK